MISADLIVLAPWVIFATALAAVCVRLLRARRAATPLRRPRQTQEERCRKKKDSAPRR
jgi:hypothetical protein